MAICSYKKPGLFPFSALISIVNTDSFLLLFDSCLSLLLDCTFSKSRNPVLTDLHIPNALNCT